MLMLNDYFVKLTIYYFSTLKHMNVNVLKSNLYYSKNIVKLLRTYKRYYKLIHHTITKVNLKSTILSWYNNQQKTIQRHYPILNLLNIKNWFAITEIIHQKF